MIVQLGPAVCASSLLLCVFVVVRAARGRSVFIPPAPFCFNLLRPGNWLRFTLHNTFIHLHILFLKYSALLHTMCVLQYRCSRPPGQICEYCKRQVHISVYNLFIIFFTLSLCYFCLASCVFNICIFNSVTVVLSPLFPFPLSHSNTWFPRRGINKDLSYLTSITFTHSSAPRMLSYQLLVYQFSYCLFIYKLVHFSVWNLPFFVISHELDSDSTLSV